MPSATSALVIPTDPSDAESQKLASAEPSSTAGSAARPQTRAATRPIPAAGNSGEAMPGGIVNSSDNRAVAR